MKKSCKHSKDNNNLCTKGCDYREARILEQKEAEKRCGVEFGKPFFVFEGLTMVADGYEDPYVVLSLGGKEIDLREPELIILDKALSKAREWCEHGWCPGAC